MKKSHLPADQQGEVDRTRQSFLEGLSISPQQTVLVNLSYQKDDFAVYNTVTSADQGKGIVTPGAQVADGLATKTPGLALFLPIADCVGAILFDPNRRVLMVSHLGRHSTEQRGAAKSVQYLLRQFSCQPCDVLVWLSPAPGADSYPLFAFDNQSLKSVNRQHFIEAGVAETNIETSPVDTATDKNYFSHSQFLKGSQKVDGRFAITAMLR